MLYRTPLQRKDGVGNYEAGVDEVGVGVGEARIHGTLEASPDAPSSLTPVTGHIPTTS